SPRSAHATRGGAESKRENRGDGLPARPREECSCARESGLRGSRHPDSLHLDELTPGTTSGARRWEDGPGSLKVDRLQRCSHFFGLIPHDIVVGLNAELPVVVPSPALDVPGIEQCANELPTSGNLENARIGTEIDGWQLFAELSGFVSQGVLQIVAGQQRLTEVSTIPRPPALDRTVDQQRTGEAKAKRDGGCRATEWHFREGVSEESRIATPVLRITIAECPRPI